MTYAPFPVPENCRLGGLVIPCRGPWRLLPATGAQAVTPAEADAAFKSLNKVYWDPAAKFFRKDEQGSKKADFWFSAQLWDTVMDQYDRTGSADVKRQINEVYDGFIKVYPDWTKANLCVTNQHILKSEGRGDGGAFKGIFVRYMKLLINDCGRTEFVPWMKANADTAWRNRRPADNIMGDDWTVPPGTRIQSQTATSAVAVILCFADEDR